MDIAEIIRLLENKLAELQRSRASIAEVGNIEAVMQLDSQIIQTQVTLEKLKLVV